MSGTIGPGFGILPTLMGYSTNVHKRLDALTEQASTGLVSQTFAGLGNAAGAVLYLNPQITELQGYQSNISAASGNMQVTQTAMTQIQQIAATFAANIPNLNGLNSSEVDNIASQANAALQQVADLVNTKNGNNYVFGGQDSSNPPIPSAANILSSGFYTQINAAVVALPAIGASATAAATLTIAGSNAPGTSPFSDYLSQPPAAISSRIAAIDTGATANVGLIASANSSAVSAGSSTTGSYMRDLMRVLATLGSLSSSQVNDPGFASLVADTGSSLNDAISAMSTDVGVLGITQANLADTHTHLSDVTTALNTQLAGLQNADLATTLTSLANVQTQLQASYRAISTANSLSLLNYLPASGG